MKNYQSLAFQIDQLRKDKIIYAVESVAATLATMLLLNYFVDPYLLFGVIAIVATLGYWIFTVIGNTKRLIKINKLEKDLEAK